MRLIVEKGVAETTVRDLAKGAGVAEGALYRHYPSKIDLVHALFREHYIALGVRLRQLQAPEKSVRAKLGAIVRETCRLFDQEPIVYRFLLLSQHEVMHRFGGDPDSPVRVLRDVIAFGQKAREVKLKNADLCVALLLGLLIQPAVSIVNGEFDGPLARYQAVIAGACERALLA